MKTYSFFLLTFVLTLSAQAENKTTAQAQVKELWQISKNYETLPCLSLQQTQVLKNVREDGVEYLTKEADIFHEKTKKFFQKNKKFICPPVLDFEPKDGKVVRPAIGSSNSFEVIYVVYPWQMEIQQGLNKDEIWKVHFNAESGVGYGKSKKKNEFTMVPLVPRDSDKMPFLIHSMKLPNHEKELVRICYPPEKAKECNPYVEAEAPPPEF